MGETLDAFTDTYTWIGITGACLAGLFWCGLLVWMAVGWYYGWDTERKMAKEKIRPESETQSTPAPPPPINGQFMPPTAYNQFINAKSGEPGLANMMSNPTSGGKWNKAKSVISNLYHKVGSKAQVVRDINYRGFLIYCCFGTATFTAVLYVMMLATNPYAFTLRVGDAFPIGFTTCTQGLLDSGICGMVTLAMIRIVVFVTNALGTATWLKWSKRSTVLYVIFIGGFRTFLALFVAYGNDPTYWTLFGIASLFGGILATSIHAMSLFDDMEWCRGENTQSVPFGVDSGTSKTRGWVPALNDAYPETPTMGRFVNTINYGFKTWEFHINIWIWLLEIIGYWLIYLFGVAGLDEFSSSIEVSVFFALDVICLLIFNAIKLWLYTAKSDYEIKSISTKMESEFFIPQQFDNRF